jgi:hypothetical protein
MSGFSFSPFSLDRHQQKGIMIIAFAMGQKAIRRARMSEEGFQFVIFNQPKSVRAVHA